MHLTVVCRRMTNAIGRNHRQIQRTCDADRRLIPPFLLAFLVSLQLDINILAAEDASQPFHNLVSGFFATASQRRRQWTFISACKAHSARTQTPQDPRTSPRHHSSCFHAS